MADVMEFPNTWEEYEKIYGFNDTEQIYTNGARLIPSFRVKQWLDHIAEQTEPQTIRCPKCGRSDYIREFGKDFSVTAEEAGFKYKCINCNTYIEPQTESSE